MKSINISKILCENLYAAQGGGCYIKDISRFEFSNSLINNSTAAFEGAFLFLEHCLLNSFRNITITKSQSIKDIGLVFIKEDNEKSEINVLFYNCIFNNESCIYYSSSSYLHLNNFLMYEDSGEITIEIPRNSSNSDYLLNMKKYENLNLINFPQNGK